MKLDCGSPGRNETGRALNEYSDHADPTSQLAPPHIADILTQMTKLTPIESEFATTEEAEAYDAWFRAQVEASLADPRPGIPHDQVMAELRAIIEAKKAKHA
ncbi:hypothetical protein TomTYG75_21140 [Sphingobium sp. TomTYG75]